MDMDRPFPAERISAGPAKPVVLITGASSGIGTALAQVFAENGHEVVLLARRVLCGSARRTAKPSPRSTVRGTATVSSASQA